MALAHLPSAQEWMHKHLQSLLDGSYEKGVCSFEFISYLIYRSWDHNKHVNGILPVKLKISLLESFWQKHTRLVKKNLWTNLIKLFLQSCRGNHNNHICSKAFFIRSVQHSKLLLQIIVLLNFVLRNRHP